LNTNLTSVFLRVVTIIGLVVLGVFLLHLAAVGGIYAFNRVKSSNVNSLKASAEAKTSPQTEVAPRATPSGFYTVKKGDTATSIAHSFGLNTDELLRANHIAEPKKLQPGQMLKVPLRKS
jgi:LysM repeat protein